MGSSRAKTAGGLVITASMSDGLDEDDYLPTDAAIGDAVTVWRQGDQHEDYVELTYDTLRVGPAGEMLAWWRVEKWRWELTESDRLPEELRGRTVTDLIIGLQ